MMWISKLAKAGRFLTGILTLDILHFRLNVVLLKLKFRELSHSNAHRDRDGKVTPDEVAAAAMYLKDTLAKEGLQQLISSLSKDKGKEQINHLLLYLLSLLSYLIFVLNRFFNRGKNHGGRHCKVREVGK